MNRSKAPLLLMEQLVMLLVFALAAALCVRAFVLSDARSQENNARTQAILTAQSVAELYKMVQNPGPQDVVPKDQTRETWIHYYDEHWNDAEEENWDYCLSVQALPTQNPLLGRAELVVCNRQGKELVSLPLAWQVAQGEVNSGG